MIEVFYLKNETKKYIDITFKLERSVLRKGSCFCVSTNVYHRDILYLIFCVVVIRQYVRNKEDICGNNL
uniref:Ovule protein n=1 Tax=Strongyloides venezuelensis TaxID=75913 RepID=A0A0K0EWC7_STRVS